MKPGRQIIDAIKILAHLPGGVVGTEGALGNAIEENFKIAEVGTFFADKVDAGASKRVLKRGVIGRRGGHIIGVIAHAAPRAAGPGAALGNHSIVVVHQDRGHRPGFDGIHLHIGPAAFYHLNRMRARAQRRVGEDILLRRIIAGKGIDGAPAYIVDKDFHITLIRSLRTYDGNARSGKGVFEGITVGRRVGDIVLVIALATA